MNDIVHKTFDFLIKVIVLLHQLETVLKLSEIDCCRAQARHKSIFQEYSVHVFNAPPDAVTIRKTSGTMQLAALGFKLQPGPATLDGRACPSG